MKARAQQLRPVVNVGKNGLAEATMELIERELENKELIKIKFLESARDQWDKKELAHEIVKKTKSELIMQVGNVVVIYKKN